MRTATALRCHRPAAGTASVHPVARRNARADPAGAGLTPRDTLGNVGAASPWTIARRGLCRTRRNATMRGGNRAADGEEWMELLTLEHFAGSVNETFAAELNEGDVPFVLVEARPLPAKPNMHRAPFSLLFRNTSSFLFPQQTYRMRHARLGELGIFLVPVARERDGFLYQAVFN
jgi:hypothetical protein